MKFSSSLIELAVFDRMVAVSASTVGVCSVVDMLRVPGRAKPWVWHNTRLVTLHERPYLHRRPAKNPNVHRNISIRKHGELWMRGVMGLTTTEGLLTKQILHRGS